ncbi:MAG: dihydropteroate synthase [Phycisphaerae bacterium]|nr:MAG: dihydropteroate synthase [Phycisphaerae bacterium]
MAIPLDRPRLIAILNVTPDSFADGGRHESPAHAADAASQWVAEGAAMIDVGGESTRPGAPRVPVDEQLRRVIPVIRAIRDRQPAIPISIDTTRAEVARAAIAEGATVINDVSAGLDDPRMLPLAAEMSAGLVLMHRAVPPPADTYSDRYQHEPEYPGGVVACVREFLAARAQAALDAGVHRDSIVLDPGLGFGKSVAQNLELIDGTPELASLGYPILSALSRKSFVGRVSLGRDSTPDERLPGTLDLSRRHRAAGARLFRVHDVAAHAAMFGLSASDSAASVTA